MPMPMPPQQSVATVAPNYRGRRVICTKGPMKGYKGIVVANTAHLPTSLVTVETLTFPQHRYTVREHCLAIYPYIDLFD